MFTGIVEELGEVVAVREGQDSAVIAVRGATVAVDARPGDSIAVNGVCLTVVDTDGVVFRADVMAETRRRSCLVDLAAGDRVNLERPVRPDGRLGGHIVQGHTDGTATVLHREPGDRWEVVRLGVPAELSRYIVEKGSVAVDGVSLTVTAVGPDHFDVSLIPTTLDSTTLGHRAVGDRVNIEVDVLAKYVERLLAEVPR
ncbi:MAG TPA: riboflavin synthase [Mycobacteriales bacterium]|nr:riboflavin synthase [Mycobacteriales bacterium]